MNASKNETKRVRIGMSLGLAVVLGSLAASGSARADAAKGTPSDRSNTAAAKKCQKGGWQTLQTGAGDSFPNQDACVAYAATGGDLFRPLLVAVPSEVVEDQGIDLSATGFHPSANATVDIETFGPGGSSIQLFATTDANGARSFTSVFTAGACANGLTGSEFTFTDSFGLKASVTVTLVCP